MKIHSLGLTAALGCVAALPSQDAPRDYPHQPVPFTAVRMTDSFWLPRIATNRDTTIRYAFEQSEQTGRIENFRVAGGRSDARWTGGYGFNDSDVSKIIEGAAYALVAGEDPELRAYVDRLVDDYEAAQEKDGFLYTLWTARNTVEDYARVVCRPELDDRWSNIPSAHQLYNAGHMYEAGVAHFLATGDRSLLEVCIRNADLVCATFGPDGRDEPPGHQEIELGLVKLYRVTGDRKYLDQARLFLDRRGRAAGRPSSGAYNQDHAPVTAQREAVGHAVRANYMYAAMADVAALTGDADYLTAIDRLWKDVVGTKLYVTGGVGASSHGEAYGDAYELPNRTAYCETCAAIANVYWNHRMFLLHGDARYADVMERSLYNCVLSGVSLDGRTFFYPNPLASNGEHQRSPWFGCACCPSNVTRFLASVGGYVYAVRGASLYVNLYAANEARIEVGGVPVALRQDTGMPWQGAVQLLVSPEREAEFALRLRIPGWARGEAVPSDLYTVQGEPPAATGPSLRIGDGEPFVPPVEAGYAVIERRWRPGDTVRFELPLAIQRLTAHDRVEDDRGRVALQRGPLVYCVEHPDVADGQVHALWLPDEAELHAVATPDLLGGMTVLEGEARQARAVATAGGTEVEHRETPFRAIPYYAWAHRGRGEMAVWLPREPARATPLPMPTIASRAALSASEHRGSLDAIRDQREPRSSGDHTWPFLHWWPKKGSEEWVQLDFAAPAEIAEVSVYWFDDTGRGECRVPSSWRLRYRVDGTWHDLQTEAAPGCELDRENTVRFGPLRADALQLRVQLQAGWAAGIHEVRIR
jgi:DUF1680 family protein